MAFMDKEFLLDTETAKVLFHDYAEGMPIYDFHNHLSVDEISSDRKYANITELWLEADHYKWRVMRAAGVDEKYITGNADPREKFRKFAEVVERLPGSPVYIWVHIELQRYFDIYEPLTHRNADEIYDKTEKILADDSMSAQKLLERVNAKVLCTVEDPYSDISRHEKFNSEGHSFVILPSYRPDKILYAEKKDFADQLRRMGSAYGKEIRNTADLKAVLSESVKKFAEAGCVNADHGFTVFGYTDEKPCIDVVEKAMAGESYSQEDIYRYQSDLMRHLVAEYYDAGFVMMLHLEPMRNDNTALFKQVGPDAGGDSIASITDISKLRAFLDYANSLGKLPKTILFNLNPISNTAFSTLCVSFCGREPGYVQLGSGWWFNDTMRGMSNQLDELMETGLLSSFVGMLTDSRSLTSFGRHEYFRRILCRKLGRLVENGEYPQDYEALGSIVKDICYRNACSYFKK